MNFNITEAQKQLAARIDDLLERSCRGELVCSNFLTPSESAYSIKILKQRKVEARAYLFGGYEDAERKRLYILPSYLSDIEGEQKEKLELYCSEDLYGAVRAIRITGSGYRVLTHRDYLGSLLSLGIERHSLGDIVVQGEHSAVIFCTDKIYRFLIENIDRVASDKVTAEEIEIDKGFTAEREFLPISDTIASNRLDCIVGALANLSREKSQTLIRSGLCEVDHLIEQRADISLKVPCTVTVRGYGKFKVLSFDGETRRGRTRLEAQKYI